jgi:outer membrane protein TolC
VYAVAFQAPDTPSTPPGGQVTPDGAPIEAPADEPAATVDINQRPLDIQPGPIGREDLGPMQLEEMRRNRANFAAVLSPGYETYNQAEAAGLPRNSRPYILGTAQALQLGLVNSRAYQFRIENIYLQSLTVTLNRWDFEPQFVAGIPPVTPTSAGNVPTGGGGSTQFQYRTREAPGGQFSTLNLTTVAGFGKLFSFGGRLLASFANTTVFNFIGTNPSQPTVQSSLPLSFVQPFLRGGGRAVTLEPLTLSERTLLYEIREFTRFRQQFFVSLLAAGQAMGNQGTATDPTIGFLSVLQQYQVVDNTRRNVEAFKRALTIYEKYAEGGASSGISQLQVDQIDLQLQQARATLIANQQQYRNLLDQYKQQIGMPPDVPLIPDVTLLRGFNNVFEAIANWEARDDHDPNELDGILDRLPALENITLDGRQLFDMSGETIQPLYADPDRLEEFLLTAERIALENRLDLMNSRGQLYDAWRNIAVQANSLLPVFNVSYNGSVFTPPTTSNPFAFSSQAVQSQLAIQAELPLVRLNERNNFRLSLITYQRQRRILMNLEDNIKFAVRQEVRQLIQFLENYQIARFSLLLALRQRDQTLQVIIAPPDAGAGGGGAATSQATQTLNFIQAIGGILNQQNALIQNWVQYQSIRLALYRDLGIMPFDEWEAYFELFPTSAGQPAAGSGPRGPAAGGEADIIPTPDIRP